nr:ribonuclease H-like domain-containing protein [Tanacetum cinerariifolium]
HNEFDMTDLGALNYFLGISATRHSTWLFLSQKEYAIEHLAPYTILHLRNFGFWISLVLFYYHLSCWGTQTRIGQAAYQQGGLLQVTVFFGDNLLPRSSKCQQTIARSSAEAEYRGVANVVAETALLHNLLRELHSPLSATTLVYYDDVSATYLSANPVQHQRTKHIEIDIHFVHELVTAGQV